MGSSQMKWEQDLTADIRAHNDTDDRDLPGDLKGYSWQQIGTACGHQGMIDHFEKVKNNCRAILEIGVADHGFSKILQETKNPDTVYIGVDIMDRSHLHKPEQNVHVLQASSNNYQEIIDFINYCSLCLYFASSFTKTQSYPGKTNNRRV
jgi:hypothetical protein